MKLVYNIFVLFLAFYMGFRGFWVLFFGIGPVRGIDETWSSGP